MLSEEARALVHAGGEAARTVTTWARQTQTQVIDQVYGALPRALDPITVPMHAVQRSLTAAGYFCVLLGLEVGARAGGALAASRSTGQAGLRYRPRVNLLKGAVDGFAGSHLARQGSPLATPMGFRQAGHTLSLTADGIRAAYSGVPHPKVAVFVHGLGETEEVWTYRSRRWYGRAGVSYGSRLQEELGYLPLYVRFNSGLRISTNGAALADLLDNLVRVWPVPLTDLVLVGHSMGGLVVDSALALPHHGAWRDHVNTTVNLGAPRDGAPLERAATALAHTSAKIAPMSWLSHLIGSRSDGIRDLRHGNIRHADWEGHHPDDPTDRRTGGGLAHGPHHYAVLSTLTSNVGHKLALRLGDGLVPAVEPGRFVTGSAQTTTVVMTGLNHFDVLNHPRVYRQLRIWIGENAPAEALTPVH